MVWTYHWRTGDELANPSAPVTLSIPQFLTRALYYNTYYHIYITHMCNFKIFYARKAAKIVVLTRYCGRQSFDWLLSDAYCLLNKRVFGCSNGSGAQATSQAFLKQFFFLQSKYIAMFFYHLIKLDQVLVPLHPVMNELTAPWILMVKCKKIIEVYIKKYNNEIQSVRSGGYRRRDCRG